MCQRCLWHSSNSALPASVNSVLWNIPVEAATRSFKGRPRFPSLSRYFGHLVLLFWFRIEISLVTSWDNENKAVNNRIGNNTYRHSSLLSPSYTTGCFRSIQQQKKMGDTEIPSNSRSFTSVQWETGGGVGSVVRWYFKDALRTYTVKTK